MISLSDKINLHRQWELDYEKYRTDYYKRFEAGKVKSLRRMKTWRQFKNMKTQKMYKDLENDNRTTKRS